MARNAFAGVAFTIALGIGTAYAVHEVGELNAEAARIEACVDYQKTHEIPSEDCEETASTAEADARRNTADTTGTLGWLAYFGAITVGMDTAYLINKNPQ